MRHNIALKCQINESIPDKRTVETQKREVNVNEYILKR